MPTTEAVLLKRAVALWRAYKVGTLEYRDIAARLGITTADLNARCSRIEHERRERERNRGA